MKELDPLVFVAVFQEMLGWLFWPLVAFIVLGALLIAVVIVHDRGVKARRLVLAELVGIAGGFAAIWLMLAVTNSQLGDLGGPIDWLLAAGIWLAGAIGATVAGYIVLAVVAGPRRIRTQQPVLADHKVGA